MRAPPMHTGEGLKATAQTLPYPQAGEGLKATAQILPYPQAGEELNATAQPSPLPRAGEGGPKGRVRGSKQQLSSPLSRVRERVARRAG